MKFRKIVSILAILAFVMGIFSFTAIAADISTAQVDFSKGELTLKEVPSVSFGENKISAKTVIYTAKTVSNKITVVDARGNSAGWAVKLNLSQFMDGSKPVLPGSSLLITPKNVISTTPVIPPSYAPVSMELVAGNSASQTFWAANQGEGNGTWSMELTPDQISLKVPANKDALPSNSQANLYWTLIDAPAN